MNTLQPTRLLIAALAACIAAVSGVSGPAAAQTAAMERYAFTDTRSLRFCEVFLVKDGGILMYNSTGLNDCPATQWNTLDTEKIKAQYGAKAVFKNGPRFWVPDTLSLDLGETEDFGGIKMRYVGTLPVALMEGKSGGGGEAEPYKVFHPKKGGYFTYSKGKAVYELVGPDGTAYVMQGSGQNVDPSLTYASLAKLGDKLQLAPGWKYRVRTLDKDLVFDLGKAAVVDAVSDDLRNIYNRVP